MSLNTIQPLVRSYRSELPKDILIIGMNTIYKLKIKVYLTNIYHKVHGVEAKHGQSTALLTVCTIFNLYGTRS